MSQRRPVTRLTWRALFLSCGLLWASCSVAQQAQIRVSGEPYYAGVPITIQLVLEGFEESPQPIISVDTPPGSTLELQGVSPNVSTSIQIINGRMSRSKTVQFVYQYRLNASTSGPLKLGPFRATQGVSTVSSRTVTFNISELPTSDAQRFRLVLPPGPIWVGQRVPIQLEWWLSEDFAERLAGRSAKVPLFDQIDRFRFEDDATVPTKNTLEISTATGTLELPLTVRREQWKNEPYLVASASRTMVALKPGTIELAPASLVAEEAVRWRRDFFGGRVPSDVRRIKVQDEKRTLEIRSPPAQGRPPSFAGAIGKGFSIDVSADRSVVQAGDPIRVRLTIKGDGALDTVSLPPLAASGLSPKDFKVPNEKIAGSVDGDSKQFELQVRVNHTQVREIPPIAFSWFNPDTSSYETTQSRPIAVSVKEAKIVSAGDVVRSAPAVQSEGAAQNPPPPPTTGAQPSSAASSAQVLASNSADLALNTDIESLLNPARPLQLERHAQAALYVVGVLILLGAWIVRRQRSVDPEGRKLRRQLDAEVRLLSAATGVNELAASLRRMAAIAPLVPRAEYEAVLSECDNLAYAPNSGGNPEVNAALRERARSVAAAMAQGRRVQSE